MVIASTALAATLLPDGTTAHSHFGIPAPSNEESHSWCGLLLSYYPDFTGFSLSRLCTFCKCNEVCMREVPAPQQAPMVSCEQPLLPQAGTCNEAPPLPDMSGAVCGWPNCLAGRIKMNTDQAAVLRDASVILWEEPPHPIDITWRWLTSRSRMS